MATKNSFVSAAKSAAGLVSGPKGEMMHSTSGVKRVDAFTNMLRGCEKSTVNAMISELITEARGLRGTERSAAVADVFRLMIHKRATTRVKVDGGEGERRLCYLYFLRLYELFPETVLELVRDDILPHYGYWKDYRHIWKMICGTENTGKTAEQRVEVYNPGMSHEERYAKYNRLIEAIREAILKQRSTDLKTLVEYMKPRRLSDLTTEEFQSYIDEQAASEHPNLPKLDGFCGKFCVREKGSDNQACFWYVRGSTGKLIVQPHTSYMVRATLRRRNPRTKQMESFPAEQSVPFGVLKSWRQCNAKLNAALHVVECRMAANEFDKINPQHVTSFNNSRYMKAFLNEKRKGKVEPHEEDTGNRTKDPRRIACRRNFRANLAKVPESLNAAALFPHQITYPAIKEHGKSTARDDYHQALWDALVASHVDKLQAAREKFAAELEASGAAANDVQKSLLAGNFVFACDISGSMTSCYGLSYNKQPKEGEQNIDIATALTAFASEVAAEPYRDLAMTFSTNPHIYHFAPRADGSKMRMVDRMAKIRSDGGLNTDYYKMHVAIANLCVEKRVRPEDIPTIVIPTDGGFDDFDSNARGSRWLTTHDKIRRMWASKGFGRIPTIVTWNLTPGAKGTQAEADTPGTMMLGGRSPSLFKYIMYGESMPETEIEVMVDGKATKVKVSSVTPWDTFRKAMDNHELFFPLLQILDRSQEGMLKDFVLTEDMVPDAAVDE